MADFAKWATACEPALWPPGTFGAAYRGNRDEAVVGVIEADPIASAVRALMAARTEWGGTASELLGTLTERAGERVAKSKTWPDSPRALGNRLRRAATFLRKIGIEIDFVKEGRARTRIIRVTVASAHRAGEREEVQPSAPSASSAPLPKSKPSNGFAPYDLRTVGSDADGGGNEPVEIVRANPLKSNGKDNADDADANSLSHSPPKDGSASGWSRSI